MPYKYYDPSPVIDKIIFSPYDTSMNITTITKIACLLIALGILVLSLIPISQPEIIQLSDKVSHLIAYSVLALFFVFGFSSSIPNPFYRLLISTGICTIYGGIIEILQGFTGRTPELLDIAADFLGALGGTLIATLILTIINKQRL